MIIKVKNNNVNKAISILKKKLHNEGIIKELRDRTHFTSKGEKKRLAKRAAKSRWKKKQRMLQKTFEREELQVVRNSSSKKTQKK